MPDTTINHPSKRVEASEKAIAEYQALQLGELLKAATGDLEAIFEAADSGQPFTLQYPNGVVRTFKEIDAKPPAAVAAKPPRKPRRTKAEIAEAKAAATVEVKPGNAEVAARIGVDPEIPGFLRRAEKAE